MEYIYTTPYPAQVPVEKRRVATLERIAELARAYCDTNATWNPILRELEQYVRDLERLE